MKGVAKTSYPQHGIIEGRTYDLEYSNYFGHYREKSTGKYFTDETFIIIDIDLEPKKSSFWTNFSNYLHDFCKLFYC